MTIIELVRDAGGCPRQAPRRSPDLSEIEVDRYGILAALDSGYHRTHPSLLRNWQNVCLPSRRLSTISVHPAAAVVSRTASRASQ